MPWFYAGPEAKPVGPVTLEELQALRANGTVSPETYVIEQTGQAPGALAWRRYKEVFSALPNLPPAPPFVPPPAPAIPVAPTAPQPHPLFPSAVPTATHSPVFTPGARPDPYYHVRPTNGWCAWGFGLGLAALFPCSLLCGSGLLVALVSIPLCIIGLISLGKNREQSGQWLAIWGLVLSGLALVISLIFIMWLAVPILKAHGLTVTEQTTNDSE